MVDGGDALLRVAARALGAAVAARPDLVERLAAGDEDVCLVAGAVDGPARGPVGRVFGPESYEARLAAAADALAAGRPRAPAEVLAWAAAVRRGRF